MCNESDYKLYTKKNFISIKTKVTPKVSSISVTPCVIVLNAAVFGTTGVFTVAGDQRGQSPPIVCI